MSLLVLTAQDVTRITDQFTPLELMNLMAKAFVAISSKSGYDAPHRISVPITEHKALFMPARLDEFGTAMKVVSIPNPGSSQRGLPASTMLMDEATGGVRALINGGSLTALRTAAGSVLATRLLLRRQPHTLCAIGSGKQIEAHVDLHLRTFPSITTVRILNRTVNDRLIALQALLQRRHPRCNFSALALDDKQKLEALKQADVICSATPSTKPLFDDNCLGEHVHINLVGSYTPEMCEVTPEVVKMAGKVVVDSREACKIEAGDLIQAGVNFGDTIELGELVKGFYQVGGRAEVEPDVEKCEEAISSSKGVTMFKSVGVGVQDVAIAAAVVSRAEELGIGTRIDAYDA